MSSQTADGWAGHAEEAQRLRLFISRITDYAIYMLSPEGRVVSWNAGAERFKGYQEHEIIGEHFSRFYTDEDRATDLPARALRMAREEGKFEAEGWRVRKDGTRMWAHVVIDPIRNEAGELVGFAKITRDNTERKQAQAELEQAREALFQSQKLEAIGKLTGGVAHDFNNLLNVLTNGLSMLRQHVRDPEPLRLIDGMETAALRGATLTQQLLAFSRQQPMKAEPRELNRLISGFEAVLRRASRSALRMDFHLAQELPRVMIDPAQFETALLNLIVNARDATPDGGRIAVATQVVQLRERQVGALGAGRYVVVSVQDSGSGMPPDVISRAVEPFFTTKELGKGTGLGLSQVYGLVQQAGGELQILSRVGEGSTISMYFPALDGDSGRDAANDDVRAADDAETVLVVDDQPDVLDMTSEMFRSFGFEVLSANSGEEALDMLERRPRVDLLFTDVVMPGMNGVELAKKAREREPGLKVILASGYSAPAGSLEGFEFLPKPFRIADLVKKLRTST